MKNKAGRRHARSRPLFYDDRFFISPTCEVCLDVAICGGLKAESGLFGCKHTCCGKPETCQWVCRRNPQYKSQVQEIGGFRFEELDIKGLPFTERLPPVIPLVYHGSRRNQRLDVPAVVIKLAAMFHRRTGAPRYETRNELCSHLMISADSKIVVCGVDDDPVLERWWGMGRGARGRVIEAMRQIGVALVTTPNFSVCVDWPRPGDFAAMMRIVRTYQEFVDGGIPTALHTNGRFAMDFQRWGTLLQRSAGISHVAYEFSTGTAYEGRYQQHVTWLGEMVRAAGRPLNLIMVGEQKVVVPLRRLFDQVTLIETTSFMKTMHRQRLVRIGNDRLASEQAPAPEGADLSELLMANVDEMRTMHALRSAS